MAILSIRTNLKQLGPKIQKTFERFPTEMDLRTRVSAIRIQKFLFRKTPKDTGAAARGWFVLKIKKFIWEVNNRVKHIDAIEFGTGLFATRGPRMRIRPKVKKFLVFPVRRIKYNLRITDFGGGPEFFITKSVKGQKPQFIVKTSIPIANRILSQEILKGLKKITGIINKLK